MIHIAESTSSWIFFSLIHSDSLNTRARIADSRQIIRNQIERRSAQILRPPLSLRERCALSGVSLIRVADKTQSRSYI